MSSIKLYIFLLFFSLSFSIPVSAGKKKKGKKSAKVSKGKSKSKSKASNGKSKKMPSKSAATDSDDFTLLDAFAAEHKDAVIETKEITEEEYHRLLKNLGSQIQAKNLNRVEYFVNQIKKSGRDFNAIIPSSSFWATPLFYAVRNSDSKIVTFLLRELETRSDKNFNDPMPSAPSSASKENVYIGGTALFAAVTRGCLQNIKILTDALIQAGITNFNEPLHTVEDGGGSNYHGLTPLYCAVKEGKIRIVEYLLPRLKEHGISFNQPMTFGREIGNTALMRAAYVDKTGEMVKVFSEYLENPEQEFLNPMMFGPNVGTSPFLVAIAEGNKENATFIYNFLNASGIDFSRSVNKEAYFYLLETALANKQLKIAYFLLRKASFINDTSLFIKICHMYKVEEAKLLLRNSDKIKIPSYKELQEILKQCEQVLPYAGAESVTVLKAQKEMCEFLRELIHKEEHTAASRINSLLKKSLLKRKKETKVSSLDIEKDESFRIEDSLWDLSLKVSFLYKIAKTISLEEDTLFRLKNELKILREKFENLFYRYESLEEGLLLEEKHPKTVSFLYSLKKETYLPYENILASFNGLDEEKELLKEELEAKEKTLGTIEETLDIPQLAKILYSKLEGEISRNSLSLQNPNDEDFYSKAYLNAFKALKKLNNDIELSKKAKPQAIESLRFILENEKKNIQIKISKHHENMLFAIEEYSSKIFSLKKELNSEGSDSSEDSEFTSDLLGELPSKECAFLEEKTSTFKDEDEEIAFLKGEIRRIRQTNQDRKKCFIEFLILLEDAYNVEFAALTRKKHAEREKRQMLRALPIEHESSEASKQDYTLTEDPEITHWLYENSQFETRVSYLKDAIKENPRKPGIGKAKPLVGIEYQGLQVYSIRINKGYRLLYIINEDERSVHVYFSGKHKAYEDEY